MQCKEGYINTLKYFMIVPEVLLKEIYQTWLKKGLIKKVGPRKLRRYELIKKIIYRSLGSLKLRY